MPRLGVAAAAPAWHAMRALALCRLHHTSAQCMQSCSCSACASSGVCTQPKPHCYGCSPLAPLAHALLPHWSLLPPALPPARYIYLILPSYGLWYFWTKVFRPAVFPDEGGQPAVDAATMKKMERAEQRSQRRQQKRF